MKNKVFKTMSGKLSAILMAICCLFATFGVGNFSAKAQSEYPISVVNYDGVDYAGVRIDKNNVDTFRESVDLSSCDLNTPIFQFVITPSERGDGKKYTPDFEKLTLTLSDSANKSLAVSFWPRTADAPKWNYICATANGENQTALGEHHNNYKDEVLEDEEERGSYLSDVYSSISPYTFDGYGADYSYFRFLYKDGSQAKAGEHGVISIYYDREENAIYSDMGFHWVDDDESQPHTLVDKFKLLPNGERRWRIRDLDKEDYKKGGNVVSTIWNGFSDLSDLSLKVTFDQKKNQDYSILLVSLGGKTLTGNYFVEHKNKGVIGRELSVPQPMYFSNTQSYDFKALGGLYTVKDPDGNLIIEKTTYSSTAKFVPTKAGVYTVEYFALDPNENVEKAHSLSITVLQEGGSTLSLNGVERNYLLYDEIDAGFVLSSTIQTKLPEVFVTIKKDGSVLVPKTTCPTDFSYRFEQEGQFTFEYEVTDYLGQVVTKSFSCSVNNVSLRSGEGISASVLYTAINEFKMPTANDYSLINAVSGTKINPTKVDIKVSLNGGEWKPLSANLFLSEGVYDILYEYHYGSNLITTQRKIAIYNDLPTVSVEKAPTNTVLFENQTFDSDSIRVKALTGKAVVFPYGYFKSSETFNVEKISGDTVEDVTSQFKSGAYSVTFNEEGEYCISAVIDVGGIYKIRKNIFIEVKDTWIDIKTPSSQIVDVGTEIAIQTPNAKDFYGNEILSGNYKVTLDENEIAVINGKFTPVDIGEYKIVYTVSDQTGSKSCEFIYYAVDRTAPTITTTKEIKSSSQGEKVTLATVQVSDNSKLNTGYSILVTYNEQVVSVVGNEFIAENEGIYKVTIIAEDASGNVTEYVYNIEIGPKNYTWIIIASICGVIVLAGGILFFIIMLKKNKARKESKEEKEIDQNEEKDN